MTEPNPEWSRPPFEPGNEVALRHGGYSPRRYEPLAESILTETRQHVTWWQPADMASAWAWAQIEARAQLVREWLTEHGGDLYDRPVMFDAQGNEVAWEEGAVRGAALLLNRLEARAESLRSKLGLDPLSRSRLSRDTAAAQVDVAQLFARLAQEEARENAQAELLIEDEAEGDDDDE